MIDIGYLRAVFTKKKAEQIFKQLSVARDEIRVFGLGGINPALKLALQREEERLAEMRAMAAAISTLIEAGDDLASFAREPEDEDWKETCAEVRRNLKAAGLYIR